MRLVSGYQPVHELYSPKSRKQHFPKADYRFLVRAALNVARAVGKVHQAGCVIGDFNHSGVLVAQDATVALIDADSFQFAREGRAFPCVVGVPDFTPPELHGLNLSTVTRTRAHDHFGLAVAIFHLLAMGKHPYAGRFAGGDLSMGEAIAQNRFAFSLIRKNETRTTPPPGSVSLQDFPAPVARAFEAAFGLDPAMRPDASQWVTALKELEAALSHCTAIKTHYYPSAARKCVWCRLAGQSGVDMFPDLLGTVPPMPGGPFDIERFWAQIRAVRLPRPEDLLPTWSGDPGSGSTAVAEAKRALNARKALGIAALIAAGAGFGYAAGAAIIWIGIGIFGLVKLLGGSIDEAPFRKAYDDADQRARNAELAFLQRMGLTELAGIRDDLERWIAEYRKLDSDLAQEIMRLKATREARQRATFLDRFPIRRARISGIGPAKTATLASYGIETAADIAPHAIMAVPGFGEAMTAKLLLWRRGHEAKFRYNAAPDASDVQAENAIRSAHAAKRADLQSKIRSGTAALQTAPQRLASRSQSVDQPLTHALGERARAARDLEILGIPVPQRTPIVFGAKPSPTPPAPAPSRPMPSAPSSTVPSCPRCGSPMRRRTARRGSRAGRQFWGCSRYPGCTGTRN
ncbi:MAG: topoisomerase DNA-binding C4 zinc finger domain-containing protein [Altererythrobacter sp.]|nr:topoisomerase DNA-binding C4 zinc finger domain-containing protein [Altererythrobacter sp.]